MDVTLDLTGKHCRVICSAVLLFVFAKNACKSAGFHEPALAANVHFADSIVSKNKSFVWKRRRQEKSTVLHTLFLKNKTETN